MDDEQFEVAYENAELRFYDRETYEHNYADLLYMENVFTVPDRDYGTILSGRANVRRYSLNSPNLLDTICFRAERGDCVLADEVGAQLWEVHAQYKRRIV